MIRTFDGLGAEYDESRIVPPRIVDAVLADALRGLDPRASTLLECGTGTGQLIARASRRLAPGHVFESTQPGRLSARPLGLLQRHI